MHIKLSQLLITVCIICCACVSVSFENPQVFSTISLKLITRFVWSVLASTTDRKPQTLALIIKKSDDNRQ